MGFRWAKRRSSALDATKATRYGPRQREPHRTDPKHCTDPKHYQVHQTPTACDSANAACDSANATRYRGSNAHVWSPAVLDNAYTARPAKQERLKTTPSRPWTQIGPGFRRVGRTTADACHFSPVVRERDVANRVALDPWSSVVRADGLEG